MEEISYQRYIELCRMKQRFIGHVARLGTIVRWEPVPVSQDYSPTAPNLLSNGANFPSVVYLPVIIPEKTNKSTPFLNAGLYAGWGGTAASVASLSKRPVILGSEYVMINSGGTLVRNTNRTFTNVGKIAGKVGNGIFGISLLVDGFAYVRGEQSGEQAVTSIVINSCIWGIGYAFPPAGAALGVIYLIASLGAHDPIASEKPRYENGVYINPNDNTKVIPTPEKQTPIPYKKRFPPYDPPQIKPK